MANITSYSNKEDGEIGHIIFIVNFVATYLSRFSFEQRG